MLTNEPEVFDILILTEHIPEQDLKAGTVGTTVHLLTTPALAYEVEFSDASGIPE